MLSILRLLSVTQAFYNSSMTPIHVLSPLFIGPSFNMINEKSVLIGNCSDMTFICKGPLVKIIIEAYIRYMQVHNSL